MTAPTPQPGPAVVLTDDERDRLNRAVYLPEDAVSIDPEEYDEVTADVHAAVERIIAARTADAAARLAAVEAREVLAGYIATQTGTAMPTPPPSDLCDPDPEDYALAGQWLAAMSATALDAGQREAQERAEVLREAAEAMRQAGRDGYLFLDGGDERVPWEAVARWLDARADRSPEQP